MIPELLPVYADSLTLLSLLSFKVLTNVVTLSQNYKPRLPQKHRHHKHNNETLSGVADACLITI